MEMKGPAQRPRLHELPAVPERVADVLLRDPLDASGELQLGRRLNLRVDATRLVHDLEESLRTRALGERAARETPRTDIGPGDALQLEKPLSVDELAAHEPGKRAPFEDLEMHR